MRSIVIPVANQRRVSGKGNYGFFKRVNLMIDIILAVTSRPLDILIHIGLLSFIASVFMIFWTVATYLLNPGIPSGYTTLVILITFFGGMNLLVLGIVGRYLSSIYMEVRNRPVFIVQDKINI
jgi:dolichol-phosphate mannosyltransferase